MFVFPGYKAHNKYGEAVSPPLRGFHNLSPLSLTVCTLQLSSTFEANPFLPRILGAVVYFSQSYNSQQQALTNSRVQNSWRGGGMCFGCVYAATICAVHRRQRGTLCCWVYLQSAWFAPPSQATVQLRIGCGAREMEWSEPAYSVTVFWETSHGDED